MKHSVWISTMCGISHMELNSNLLALWSPVSMTADFKLSEELLFLRPSLWTSFVTPRYVPLSDKKRGSILKEVSGQVPLRMSPRSCHLLWKPSTSLGLSSSLKTLPPHYGTKRTDFPEAEHLYTAKESMVNSEGAIQAVLATRPGGVLAEWAGRACTCVPARRRDAAWSPEPAPPLHSQDKIWPGSEKWPALPLKHHDPVPAWLQSEGRTSYVGTCSSPATTKEPFAGSI